MKVKKISIDLLLPNLGQIDGLPTNPRRWSPSDVDKLAKSLEETPELFEIRPIIAVPFEDKYIILGGNMRYEGAKQLGMSEVPCVVFDDLSIDKMKEIVIKDNGSFGMWDNFMLDQDWGELPLADWGIPNYVKPEFDEEAINALFNQTEEKKKDETAVIEVVLPAELSDLETEIREVIKAALDGYDGIVLK